MAKLFNLKYLETMPNLIYCALIMKGSKKNIQEVKTSIETTDQQGKHFAIDFQKIIPMPSELNISETSDAMIIYKRDYLKKQLQDHELIRIKKMSPAMKEESESLAKQYHANKKNHGHCTWYDWCVKNWGTKWNAVIDDEDTERNKSGDIIFFATAWSIPLPIINTLVCRFTKVKFTLEYFDEEDDKDITTVHFKVGKP